MVGIRQLKAAGNIPVARHYPLLKAGQMVRVVDGPFAAFKARSTGLTRMADSRSLGISSRA
jgi:transcription antitermination factor NusG